MTVTAAAAAAMQSVGSEHQQSRDCGPSATCALWPVDMKITHIDWNSEATLIHFQGQYLTICDLDYNILQGEIQSTPKTKAAVDIGEFCLVEDLASARWYRGRVQNRKVDLFDIFLVDHGNILSVDIAHVSSCSNDLFILPAKIVCGFLANVLLLESCSHSVMEEYFSSLIGRNVTGYIQALLPHKILLLEAPDINNDLVRHGFGRHVDTHTFIFLVEMLTEVPLNQNIQPVPDLLIEKQRGHEFCFKPSGLQGYENILPRCRPVLSCGTCAKVRVTAAVNPRLFYCQMANMKTDLCEMSKKLAAVCEHRTKVCSQTTPENLGLLCSVKSKDGKWYRGFVQCLPINSHIRVLFIDYGFFESVKVENVHKLPPDLYSTPIVAFPCSLSCLGDQDETVRTQQLSLLKTGLLGGVLDMEISSFDEEQHLYTVTLVGAGDNNVKEPQPIKGLPRREEESVSEKEELPPKGGYLYYETIMRRALGKKLEAEEVQVDSVFVGYVEHVLNPNHFWIRTQKRNHEFEEMMTKMTDHFSRVKLDEDVLLNPEPGTLCCAVYEKDMHFYRGVVTDILEHGAEVLFIDFGNVEKVPHMLIKKIPEAFASKSAFAFSCTLLNVIPLDEVWSCGTSDFFRRAVTNKALLVHVVHMRKSKFVVDLFEMGCYNKQSITDLLISSKQLENWSTSVEPVVQNADATARSSVATDIGGNTEQSEDKGREEDTCKNEIKVPQAPVSFKALCIKPGFEFAVNCINISSPTEFWCQPQGNVPALEELMDKIQQYYSTNTAPLQSGVACCVAKSPLDGRWHRAFIIEKQKNHARVMLIDYGFTVQIKEENLEAILQEYVHLEGQAFRCSLSNLIEPTDSKSCGSWSPELCNAMKKFVLDSNNGLRCKVVSQMNMRHKGLCNVVDLYNTRTQQSVTNRLMELGLAREATVATKQLPTVSPETFVYSSYDLSPGNEEQVYVTHVSSQRDVYCQLARNTEIIDQLEKKIFEESEKMTQASARAVVRKLCLAKYFDGKWYRGLAHPVQSPLHLSVFFVDYGNKSIPEKTNVAFIPRDAADLLHTPMQALRCCLASVPKEELYADVKEWLDKEILNKQVKAVVLGKSEDGSFDVALHAGDVNINEKVNELILSLSPKQKAAVTFSKGTRTKTPRALHMGTTETTVKCKRPAERKSLNRPTSNPCRGTQVRNALPKKREYTNTAHGEAQNQKPKDKPHNVNKTKGCSPVKPLGNTVQLDTNTKSERPQNTNIAEMHQLSCLPDKKVSVGLRTKCFTSHIDSVDRFFLQVSEDEPAILKMAEDLNLSVFRNSLKTATSLRINDLVLAVYEEDGALYRSLVKDREGSACFVVEFIDYGNSAVVGKEKIYLMPKECLSQPRFSFSCCLSDTSAFENDASFTDAVTEKPLMVDFVCQDGPLWKVKVEILDGEAGVSEALEAAVDSGPTNENERGEAPASSTEMEPRVSSCEQHNLKVEMSTNQTTTSERITLETPAVAPTELKVKTSRRHSGPTTTTSNLKRNPRKTSTSSVKAEGNGADAFVPPTIRAKDRETVSVLSVQSNGDFYVRLARTSFLLAALESCIADDANRCEMMVEDDVKQGLKCLVQVHTGEWQRAVVHHVGGGKCEVLLVDQGTTEDIPSASIRRQCADLNRIPNLAVLCKMNCLGFSEGEDAAKFWCDTLKPMVGKEVNLVFVCYSEAENIWMVEIVVNGLFLIRQMASLQRNKETITSNAETQNEEPISDTSLPQQLALAPIDIDKVNLGFAAAVTTPFEFCVVLEDLLLTMNRVSVLLDELPGRTSPLAEAHLVPGACCLFKSDSKNKWCRTEIVHVDTTVVLYLVDYGHYEGMPREDGPKLQRLPEALIELPRVTCPCILRGVKPVGEDGQWSDEAAVFFQRRLYRKHLQIFFRELVSNTHWKVDVLADGVHVAKELVDAGHADYIDVMLGLRFQEQVSCEDPRDPDSERESDLLTEVAEEAEGRTSLGTSSGSRRCVVM
ncbi:tudor domain-containing protein 15 [Scophthalmus maximus]|uniref:tudor domain-containing protein 15 n=1 Tax=Scophthalmus maximus TaxID=52904 RepID=UPI001FA84602|nr:tudor domain-containing protein 15 [Scophthalmus maximus]